MTTPELHVTRRPAPDPKDPQLTSRLTREPHSLPVRVYRGCPTIEDRILSRVAPATDPGPDAA